MKPPLRPFGVPSRRQRALEGFCAALLFLAVCAVFARVLDGFFSP